MQDSLRFPASKKKAVLLLLGSVMFVAGGFWMREQQPIVGWLCIGFFGLGIPASLYMALTEKVYLLLDPQGFEMGSPVKTVRVSWQEVDGFEMASVSGNRMIEIIYNESYKDQRLLRSAARVLSNVEGAIANTYVAPLTDILQSLREWHARFVPTERRGG